VYITSGLPSFYFRFIPFQLLALHTYLQLEYHTQKQKEIGSLSMQCAWQERLTLNFRHSVGHIDNSAEYNDLFGMIVGILIY
jgi:hypothetical protein